jgi:hypothetical protein
MPITSAGKIEITIAAGMFAEGNSPIAKIIVKTIAKGKVENALKMNASKDPICLTRPVASLVKTFLSLPGELAKLPFAKEGAY